MFVYLCIFVYIYAYIYVGIASNRGTDCDVDPNNRFCIVVEGTFNGTRKLGITGIDCMVNGFRIGGLGLGFRV